MWVDMTVGKMADKMVDKMVDRKVGKKAGKTADKMVDRMVDMKDTKEECRKDPGTSTLRTPMLLGDTETLRSTQLPRRACSLRIL